MSAPDVDNAPLFELRVTDNIGDMGFVLELESKNHPICLTPENWPSEQGQINFGGERFSLIVEGGAYPMADHNLGYCPDCAVRVPAGGVVTARIPYSEFGLPADLHQAEKQLVFSPSVYRC